MQTDRKILTYAQLSRRLAKERKGKTVAVATGTFDLLHCGHLLFLDFAKRQGDILVVAVGSDRIIKFYKDADRPIIPQELRTRLVAGLEAVDYVVLLDEDPVDKISGRKLFPLIKPEVLVVPYRDHNPKGMNTYAKEIGMRLVRNPRIVPGRMDIPLSTSYIIDRVQKLKKTR